MYSKRFRILSFTLLLIVEVLVILLIFFYNRVIFGSVGISSEDVAGLLPCMLPFFMIPAIVWERLVLGVPLPYLKQTLLHPDHALGNLGMKILLALYVFVAAIMYSHYLNSLASLVSIGIIVVSSYVMMVIFEASMQMTKDERAWHPFKQDI